MGTTAEKFDFVFDTKDLLKDNINKINNVLDDNSTFRSYPRELFNGYLDVLNNGTDTLWNNLEKVSASGEEATLENVETAPIKMVLNGNTSQDTTSGKNLLGLTNGTYSHNGITAVVNDGTITITGTATANSFVNIPLLKDIVLSNEQVTVSINNATTISDTATEFRVYESGNNYIPVQFTTIDRKTTITKTGTFVSAYVRTTSGVSYDDGLVIKPQLEYGSTATSWEKYTGGLPSPNPDYPQQVKVVTGENVVSVQGKNLFNTENRIKGYFENQGVIINGSTSRNTIFFLKCLPNTRYSFSSSSYSNLQQVIMSTTNLYPDYGVQTLNTRVYFDFPTLKYQNFITDENANYIVIRMQSVEGVAIEDVDISNFITDFQVEQNSQATPYVPYSKTDYPIDLFAKNIFDKDNANILNAWINASTKVITGSNSNRTIWVEVKSNTTYKVKKIADTSSNGRFRVGSSPNPPVVGGTLAQTIQDDTAEEITITTSATDKYIAVFCYNTSSSISLDDILSSLEIREANAVYEEMCKIGDYKDYFYKDSGKWYVHKEIGKIIFDGSESWSRTGTAQSTEYFRFRTSALQNLVLAPSSSGVLMNAYCDLFVIQTANDTYKRIEGISAISNGQMDIYYEPLKEYTASEFKTWLSNNNVTLYYILATPTETEITNTTLIEQLEAIYKAKSVKDKTYITQTNEELPFILDVEAIKEYNVE